VADAQLADLVRQGDPERYLAALFASAERREPVFALLAFNYEIARAREVVREPLLGRIRLQWWRETLDAIYAGTPVRAHEVALPLAAAIQRLGLPRAGFERLLEAREQDLEGAQPESLAALESYCEASSGELQVLQLEALGAADEPARRAARQIGTAYALSGLIRALPFHARAQRIYLPRDLAAAAQLSIAEVFALRASPALATVVREVAARAEALLHEARAARRSIAPAALPALLEARLASLHLRRLARAGYDPFDPRLARPLPLAALALARAAWSGRF